MADRATEVDLLGRGRYVDALAEIAASADTPLVIALYGAWGSGKTSLLLQIRRALEPQFDGAGASDVEPPRARTVWFDPWMHQFDRRPALGLLHAMTSQLGLAAKQRVVDALTRIAVALAEDVQIPYIGLRVGRLFKVRDELAADEFRRREEQARLQEHFHEVLRQAGAPDTRLVFFIDDLDRCQPAVALALLEALKLYLDFPGCVFILGVDRQPLEAAIAATYRELGIEAESYLDKIVQVPFAIPRIDETAMKDYVAQWIPDELDPCKEILATAGADDPRQVKRILNSLVINHRLVDREQFSGGYDPRILATLVLLQNVAPALYRLVRINPGVLRDLFKGDGEGAGETERELWARHVAIRPRLEQALRLVDVPEGLDITPYLTLTAAVGQAAGREQLVLEEVVREHDAWLTTNGATGRRADLAGASLRRVSLVGARLARADLSRADLFDADLNQIDLGSANLERASLEEARLHHARLTGASLRRALLVHAELLGADLRDASLRDASLSGADLTDAYLDGADLTGADLANAELSGATWDDQTVWPADFEPPAAGPLPSIST